MSRFTLTPLFSTAIPPAWHLPMMPEMDGFAATRHIREAEMAGGRRIPIAAMTAHAMTGDRERCLTAGMDDYLSKPLETTTLLAFVDRIKASPIAARTAQQDSQPPANEGSEKALPFFSRETLLENLEGDEALMGRLIGLYDVNTPRLLDEMRTAIARRSGEDLAFGAHALRSYLGIFGAFHASNLTMEIETQAENGNFDDASLTLAALERGMGEIGPSLLRFPSQAATVATPVSNP